MKNSKLFLTIVFIAVSIVAVIALFIAISALNIAKTRPVSLEQITIQSHDINIPRNLNFAGEKVPVEMFNIKERFERELLSNCYFHSNTMILLKRSQRWFPVIEPILKEYGIPDDFKYLCVIESSLTNAVSPAGATGFWQFMESTAKDMGLKINKDVDMRYNVELETRAACRYFLKSYERFQNWTLVAASFNAGTRRVEKFMKEQKVNSYYDMLMAEETERYIFRIVAIKTIFENPERYGIFVSKNITYQPFRYKTVIVDYDVKNWADFAQEYEITYKLLKTFNPWLRSKSLKVKKDEQYEIKIPLKPFNLTYEDITQISGKELDSIDDLDSIGQCDSIADMMRDSLLVINELDAQQ